RRSRTGPPGRPPTTKPRSVRTRQKPRRRLSGVRKAFHVQLAEAESLCVEMAGDALGQVRAAMEALRSRDESQAEQVVAGDDRVDADYIELERRILTLLATQAPVASDLRLVSVLLHVNIALERVGDLATNIAK